MPDPTAHADDMKSFDPYVPPTVKDNETLPPLWWFNPWNTVLGLLHKVDHLKSTSRGEQASRISAEQLMAKYCVAFQDAKHEKAEAVAALGEHARNYTLIIGPEGVDLPACIKALVEAHKTANDWNKELTADRNSLLLAMETEVKRIPGYHSLENSIDLVKWAVDEVIDLRKEIRDAKAELTEAKDNVLKLVEANEKADRDMTKAEARIKQLTVFCENAGAERDREKKRVEEITLMVNERDRWIETRDKEIIRLTNLTRNLKRKLSKAEKAKPLWEDKTRGSSFIFGNHEDRPIRAALGSIRDLKTFVHGIQPKAKKAKAKKKGGAK